MLNRISASIVKVVRTEPGALLIALTGLGMIGYAVAFIVRNFTHLVELGLDAEHGGASRAEIEAFSPDLVEYISHVQVNLGGFIASTGLALALLAWFGVARGAAWAWWGVLAVTLTWVLVGGPIHYVYDLATLAHVAPGVVALMLLALGLYLSRPGGRDER